MRKRVFGHMRAARVKSDQGLRCPLKESFDTIECITESKCLDETLRMRRMNLNLDNSHMFEDTVLLDAAQMK